jgi:hypothetical protein
VTCEPMNPAPPVTRMRVVISPPLCERPSANDPRDRLFLPHAKLGAVWQVIEIK